MADHEGEDADIGDEKIEIKVEESELDRKRAQMMECATQNFVTCLEVQDLIAAETAKPRSHHNAPVLTRLVEKAY